MDLTSIKYEDQEVEIECSGYRGDKLIYKILIKGYDLQSKYGPIWSYRSLAMVYDQLFERWTLEHHTHDHDLVLFAETYQSQQLPYGHVLPLDAEADVRWTKIHQDKFNPIMALKNRVVLEEYIYVLRAEVFDKIRPFTRSIYHRLGDEMKTRITELFMLFYRLFRREGARLPEEMILKVMWNLEVITL